MSNLTKISDSLEETIKDGELQNVTIDIAETISDTFINDGLLKDLPLLGIVFGLRKTVLNIQDQLFIKKLIYFLSELSKVPKSDRFQQIIKIESDDEYRVKVGEKLLYIIERCEDYSKAEIIGKLFCAFLKKEITYEEFLKCSNAIDNLFFSDISFFLNHPRENLEIDKASQFIVVGLMKIIYKPAKMVDMGRIRAKPSGTDLQHIPGSTIAMITETGKALKLALGKT